MNADGKSVLHTQSAHLMFDNTTLGGTLADDVVRVDRWSGDLIAFIRTTPNPGIYLDPLGFMILLNEHDE